MYAFIRRQGHAPASAEDLVQDFFARLLEKKYLEQVDRSKGKFRSFLLAAMKHFLSKERDKATTQKRGGGRALIALDGLDAEARYARAAFRAALGAGGSRPGAVAAANRI